MTICLMRIACWIPTATNTLSEYTIFIPFPLQQWLHESASFLRYTYTVCLVIYHRKCVYCAVRIQSLILIQVKLILPRVKISDTAWYSRKREKSNDKPHSLVSTSVFWEINCLHLRDRPCNLGGKSVQNIATILPGITALFFRRPWWFRGSAMCKFVNEIPLRCCD